VRRAAAVALCALALALSALAVADRGGGDRTKLRLERIDDSELGDGILKVYASVVELEGTVVDDKGPGSFTLYMGSKSLGRPEKVTKFQGVGEPLDLVLVVETSALYGPQKAPAPPPAPVVPPAPTKGKGAKGPKPAPAPKPTAPAPAAPKAAPLIGKGKKKRALPAVPPGEKRPTSSEEPIDKVKDALRSLLEELHPKWRVLVIEYGGDVIPHPPFRNAASAVATVDELSTDEESGDLRLVDAVNAALTQLNPKRAADAEPEAPRRKLIVVVSDGLNISMDRRVFKKLGDNARAAHVPIHSIAFSPTDDRGPLLNLGEISKRSNGTFRWAKTGEDLRAQIETLVEELNKQYVLTFKVKDLDTIANRSFRLRCEDLDSNDYLIGNAAPPKPRDWLWGLIGLGGLLLLGGLVLLVVKLVRGAADEPAAAASGVVGKGKPKKGKQPPVVQQQPAAQPQHHAAAGGVPAQAAAARRATLIVIDGKSAGQQHALTPGAAFYVGKAMGHLIIADDPTVSSQHAMLSTDAAGAWVLTDLGSTNGTWLNNQRITQPTYVRDGDLVRFGNTQVKFRMD
jgi:hypothetical protein